MHGYLFSKCATAARRGYWSPRYTLMTRQWPLQSHGAPKPYFVAKRRAAIPWSGLPLTKVFVICSVYDLLPRWPVTAQESSDQIWARHDPSIPYGAWSSAPGAPLGNVHHRPLSRSHFQALTLSKTLEKLSATRVQHHHLVVGTHCLGSRAPTHAAIPSSDGDKDEESGSVRAAHLAHLVQEAPAMLYWSCPTFGKLDKSGRSRGIIDGYRYPNRLRLARNRDRDGNTNCRR